ncbi:MAG TPA: helix-turn-helix domain-containing protein [Mycobacterium sp.]|jgi:transposase-like protein|nr:helix-turn-helix domain-containing protein [Mycobacterium sp.]
MQRYSNLDTPSKTLQILRTAGLITPDGRPVPRSDRSTEPAEPSQPFKLDQRLKPEILSEIIACYEAGEPSTALAASHSLSKGSVIRLVREAGIPIRRQGLTNDQITEAIQLYGSGMSLAKVGARFGVDHGTVWRALKKRGMRMRDTHGRER